MDISNKKTIDRIESRKIDKTRKVILYCGIGMILLSTNKLFSATASQITGIGWWFDTILVTAIPIYFLLKNQRQLLNRTGQFIEWNTESIIFKLKNETAPTTIRIDQIDTVEIHLDIIEISGNTNQKYILDISDFDRYEDRLKIKSNFEIYTHQKSLTTIN